MINFTLSILAGAAAGIIYRMWRRRQRRYPEYSESEVWS